MIITLKDKCPQQQIDHLTGWLERQGIGVHLSRGKFQTIIGLIGDVTRVDKDTLEGLDIVERVIRISEPFKSANRKFHPDDTVVGAGGARIGGGHFALIAGPCSVESPEQILEVARRVKAAGATMLRGGAFKPRTSPYDFQGLGKEGLDLLLLARQETGLPIVSEIMNSSQLPLFADVDVIQVGARNMQNFDLLRDLGKMRKPVLIKRGLANTVKELLMSAEYVMAGGNKEVILCERGIRTFETYTRNTLDISAIPVIKELSHLPVVADPSHACGAAKYVVPLALGAVAAGADGLMVEVHNNPANARCDGPQSLTPEQFDGLTDQVRRIREVVAP
ncbi:MAG: 3-deoxy-7-phosphoheptulonate synthase [Kiritimatiellaeota bacterium]|nr:3-deoxy-7-phosphoheptulonate synthase [Kiritimatiellota bacterium]